MKNHNPDLANKLVTSILHNVINNGETEGMDNKIRVMFSKLCFEFFDNDKETAIMYVNAQIAIEIITHADHYETFAEASVKSIVKEFVEDFESVVKNFDK